MSLDQSFENSDLATEFVVRRWRRYQHDRAYVKAGGCELGYRDLVTGAVHCPYQSDIAAVRRSTAALFDSATRARQSAECLPRHGSDAPARPATLAPDQDLAEHLPGQAARARARELRDAAPVRTFLARAVGARTDERAWRIGADGEQDVARQLSRLPDGWRVLHAVPVGDRGSDIDHVVIGPSGVFTINAKHHPDASVWVGGDTVKINGFDQPYVRNSRHEAERASRLLSAAAGFEVPVRAVIAVVGAQRPTVRQQPRDVAVLTLREVTAHLRGAQDVWDERAVAAIFAAARHRATWQPRSVAWQELAARDGSG